MISENARYWIWISKALGYNNIKVKRIFKLYNDIAEFVHVGEKEWKHCGIRYLKRYSIRKYSVIQLSE